MKNIALLLLTTIIVAACTLEDSDNGDLDGYWHLTKVDTLATGGNKDLSNESLFWAIQGKLLYLRDNNDVYKECIGHFKVEGDSLYVVDMYYFNRKDGDPKIFNVDVLRPYGLNKMTEDFEIVTITGSKAILQSDDIRLYFKKF